jgi:hypothetical protein
MIDISDKVMQAIELFEMMTEAEAVAWVDAWLKDYSDDDDSYTDQLEGILEGDCDVENYV